MLWNFIFLQYVLLLVLLTSDQAFVQSAGEIPFLEFGSCRCPYCVYRGNEDKDLNTINIAFNKPTTYKALLEGYAPACASVNGVRSNEENRKPPYNCIHTGSPLNEPQNHWIEYDLLNVYTIDTVILYRRNIMDQNRFDTNRLRSYDITVDGEICWKSASYSDGSMASFLGQLVQKIPCRKPLTGQIVRFGKRNEFSAVEWQYHYLVYCEVIIWICAKGYYGNPATSCSKCPSPSNCNSIRCDNYFGCNTVVNWNVAIKKPATQSSVSKGGPQNAVDGGLLSDSAYDCTMTDILQDGFRVAWWQVDLGRFFRIMFVKITNLDCCGADRMKGFDVLVSREAVDFTRSPDSKQLCHKFYGRFASGETKSLDCNSPLVGRYVAVTTKNPFNIEFCEVQAYGHLVEEIIPGEDCNTVTNSRYCAVGTTCIANKCRIGLGGSCADSNRGTCTDGATCDDGICVLAVRSSCAGSNAKCVKGAICDPKSGSTCRMTLDSSCEGSESCVFGTTCDQAIQKCRIPVQGSCSSSPGMCTYRASCDAGSGNLCKWDMAATCGNTDECKTGLVCDYFKRCKTPIGHSCKDSSECIGGASCENSKCFCTGSTANACDPQEGRAGGPCSPNTQCVDHSTCSDSKCKCDSGYEASEEQFSCKLSMGSGCQTSQMCNTGLVCDEQICRIETGNKCDNNSMCKINSQCDSGICKLKPGNDCSNASHLCGLGSMCNKGFCKMQFQDTCDESKDYCTEGTMCSKTPEDKTPICRLSPGTSCAGQKKTFCVDRAVCDDNVCKVKLGKSCAEPYQNHCTYGTKCDGGKCRVSLGSDCFDDDECAEGSVCDLFHFQCRLEADRLCTAPSPNDMCSSGTICSNVNKCTCHGYGATVRVGKKCEPANKKIGGLCNANQTNQHEICDDPYAHCVPNYYSKAFACQCLPGYEVERTNYTCGAGAGTACGNVNITVPCITGLICDLNGHCSLVVGQRCNGEKRRWCKTGAVCERDMCKANFNHDCSGSNRDKCKSYTACDILSKCKFPRKSTCSSADVCVAGSTCENNICECNSDITKPAGDICEAADGVVKGKCKSSSCSDPNARCTEKQMCECNDGFTVHPTDLTCKISVGYPCSILEPLCTVGTICDETKLQCSLELGQFCGNGNENHCITGGICDISKECKLDWNQNCNGTNSYHCKYGTTCDWYERCRIGVPLRCNINTNCVAGATCVDSICQCVESEAFTNGYICEPKPGYIGGACDDVNKCIPQGSICNNLICFCDSAYLVSEEGFHCTEATAQLKQAATGGLQLLFLLAIAAVLCVGICVGLAIRKNRKRQKAIQEVSAMKSDREQLAKAMDDAYGPAPAGDPSGKTTETSEATSTAAGEDTSTVTSTAASEASSVYSGATSTAANEDPSAITMDATSVSEVSVTDSKKTGKA